MLPEFTELVSTDTAVHGGGGLDLLTEARVLLPKFAELVSPFGSSLGHMAATSGPRCARACSVRT
jgi:hypothetical protein